MPTNDQLELFTDSDLESCTASSGIILAPETNASAWDLCGRYIRTKIIPGDPEHGGVIVAGFCIHPSPRNLRIMAAAPELLEALKRVSRYVAGGFTYCPGCNHVEEADHAADCYIAAAIAKAEGK